MKYSSDQTIDLKPDHELHIMDEGDIETSHKPVEIKIKQNIYSPDSPFLTYWEIEYLDSTPNRERGEIEIMTEGTISSYEVSGTEEKQTTEIYGSAVDAD